MSFIFKGEVHMSEQKVYNRWTIATMATLLQVALGTVYAWSFWQKPLVKTYGWTNTQAAWAFSIAILFLGVGAAVGGIKMAQGKVPAKVLAMTGGALFGIGYFIAAFALSINSLPLLYLGYGVIGGLGLGMGYVTPVSVAAKWFPDKKGLVTGMVVMGFGFGALLMAKILAPIGLELAGGNLVTVFYGLGVVMLVLTLIPGTFMVIPPTGWVPPTQLELHAAGPAAAAEMKINSDYHDSITAGECLASGRFIMMWLVLFLNVSAGIMFISFQSPMLQDILKKAYDATQLSDPAVIAKLAAAGATLIGISSLFNGIGRFFWGAISDKIGRTNAFRLMLGTQIFVFIGLLFVNSAFIFGVGVCYVILCYGGGFGTMPSYVLDTYGPRLMPVVYGVILTAWGFGGVVGPQIVAYFKDNFAGQAGRYVFMSASALLALGMVVTLILKDEKWAPKRLKEPMREAA
jgi:OFA family oxalate/formate antiporter-like MFS transporter